MNIRRVKRAYPTALANSTLLPLLLLSVAESRRHAPEPTFKKMRTEYDYVIVGAGSAGSVVAGRLSELPCVTVLLLLEAGTPPPAPGFKTEPQKHTGNGLIDRRVAWPSGKAVGGSGVLNEMIPRDYDRWAEEGARGWSYRDLLPYFKKIACDEDREIASNGRHSVLTSRIPLHRSEVKEPIFRAAKSMGYKTVDPDVEPSTGYHDTFPALRRGQRCRSTAKAYLVSAENRTNLDILPNAMVRKVIVNGRRAKGVLFDHRGKTHQVYSRREVIVSAGALKTAQLLMLSGIGPEKELRSLKVPVHADLPVGRNLQDHVAAFAPFRVRRRTPHNNIHSRTGPLTGVDFLYGVAFPKNKSDSLRNDFPQYQLYFSDAKADLFAELGLKQEVLKQVYGPYEGDRGFLVCASRLPHPRSRGTVKLKSRNPYAPPAIDPNYLAHPKDVRNLVKGLKACLRIGSHPIMKRAGIVPFDTLVPGCEKLAGNEDKYLACVARSYVLTSGDYVGTARMGNPRDPRAVVDPQLRVVKIKGLRVVDASVIPVIPSGNMNMPTIVVAEKASDIIKSTINCYKSHESRVVRRKTEDSYSSHEPHNYYPLDPEKYDEYAKVSDPSDEPHNYPLYSYSEDSEDHNPAKYSDPSDEPHNYPLDPDSEDNEEYNPAKDSDSSDEHHNYPLDPDPEVDGEYDPTKDSDSSNEPHNYPLDPDSEVDGEYDAAKDSDSSDKPHNYPLNPDSQPINENKDPQEEDGTKCGPAEESTTGSTNKDSNPGNDENTSWIIDSHHENKEKNGKKFPKPPWINRPQHEGTENEDTQKKNTKNEEKKSENSPWTKAVLELDILKWQFGKNSSDRPSHSTSIPHPTNYRPSHSTSIPHPTNYRPSHSTSIPHPTNYRPLHSTSIPHPTNYRPSQAPCGTNYCAKKMFLHCLKKFCPRKRQYASWEVQIRLRK